MPILSFVKKHLSSKSQSCTFPSLIMDEAIVVGVKLGRSSIADKIAALQRKSEQNWMNGIRSETAQSHALNEDEKLDRKTNNKETSVLAARVCQLEKAQDDWKCRLSSSDVLKLSKSGHYGDEDSKGGMIISDKNIKRSPLYSNCGTVPPQYHSPNPKQCPKESAQIGLNRKCERDSKPDLNLLPAVENSEKVIVRFIARNDNETFTQFFSSLATGAKFRVDDSSFKAMQSSSAQRELLGTKRNLRVNRKHMNVRNPVKSLAKRISTTGQYYCETKPENL